MHLRDYTEKDLDELLELFYSTVHSVCCQDYNQKQIDTWAPRNPDQNHWKQRLSKCSVQVLENDQGEIIGFGSLQKNGHLDHLYTHQDYQSKGAGSQILMAIEKRAKLDGHHILTTDASETARPFFLKKGFVTQKRQTTSLKGVAFTNYRMQKKLA